MQLSFAIEGVTQLSRNFKKIDEDLKDWTDEFRATGEYLKGFFSGEVFDTEGSVFNEQWQELSPRYAAEKAKRYPGKGILVASGKMRDSFEFEAHDIFVRVFNPTPYFVYHQSKLPRKFLPRRIMMKLDETRKQAIVQIFHAGAQRHIESVFRK